MPRYINPDNIRITSVALTDEDGTELVSIADVRRAIAQTPSEDVVPRPKSPFKPCPFCGGDESNLFCQHSNGYLYFFVECGVCGVRGKSYRGHGDKEDEDFWDQTAAVRASEAWNRRANNVT